jgi:hypothetical protein
MIESISRLRCELFEYLFRLIWFRAAELDTNALWRHIISADESRDYHNSYIFLKSKLKKSLIRLSFAIEWKQTCLLKRYDIILKFEIFRCHRLRFWLVRVDIFSNLSSRRDLLNLLNSEEVIFRSKNRNRDFLMRLS